MNYTTKVQLKYVKPYFTVKFLTGIADGIKELKYLIKVWGLLVIYCILNNQITILSKGFQIKSGIPVSFQSNRSLSKVTLVTEMNWLAF